MSGTVIDFRPAEPPGPPGLPSSHLLREAATMARLWAHELVQASPGDVAAAFACVYADNLETMADRFDRDHGRALR